MNLRIGNGYDTHRLVRDRPLILGGQRLEHPAGLGLDGHSDADVLVHAVMDKLGALSSVTSASISQQTHAGRAPTAWLLEQVVTLVTERGWQVVNVDSVAIAERPKPSHIAMRTAIASAGACATGVKATTNEKLDWRGGKRAFRHAVALLSQS